jgi:ABC-type branched-subunit amino acid transport system ATPase component
MSVLLEATDIHVSFHGLHALRGVSLDVDEGAVVGLIGPNGAGKTTLFNVISGLQQADAGTIRLAGQDITALPAERRARLGVARSFQHLGLMMDETVRTNVLAAHYLQAGYRDAEVLIRPRRWWRRERDLAERAWRVLDELGLASRFDDVVADLSFATARTVELACVLATDARIVLLDEPTTGLDVAEVRTLLAAVNRMREDGVTVLTIAHDVRFVMDLCNVVYVLAEGRLISAGTPGAVQRDPAVIDAYLGRAG